MVALEEEDAAPTNARTIIQKRVRGIHTKYKNDNTNGSSRYKYKKNTNI